MTRIAKALLAAAIAVVMVLTAGPAQAGPWDGVTAWETAYVKRIVDGDTLIVTDEVTGAQSRIRLLGINSPESPHGSTSAGQCGGWQATEALKSFLPVGAKVRLLSADPSSKGKANRPQRVVLAYNESTKEFDLDIAWAMAERGWGLWYTVAKEAAMSSLYRQVIERAQERREGMWNPTLCGTDQPDASLSLRIHRSAPGAPVNDEYVVVKNEGLAPADISGWVLRDSGNQAWFQFPGGSLLAPGDYRVVHTGAGTPTVPQPRDLYVGHKTRLYTAAGQGPALLGDGAYLLDRFGNFRFWREYPCTTECLDDPYSSALVIDEYSLGEKKGKKRAQTQWVRIKNRGTVTHCLDGYRIETGNTRYSFQPGTCISPGGTWTLNVGRPPKGSQIDFTTTDFLRMRTPALWASGTITMLTDQDRVIAKRTW